MPNHPMTTSYSVADAIQMLRDGGIDVTAELSNVSAAYADITDEIEMAGGEADFSIGDFEAALRAAGVTGGK